MHILRSKNILVDGTFIPACLHLNDGKIVAIQPWSENYDQDYGRLAILPGCIDVHVHINEPGRTEWEGYETGTQAAIAGGTTTIIDMPLNCIPATTDIDSLEIKRKSAQKNAFSNIGFWGGAVPGNHKEIMPLADAGVRGFKCFMVPSGVDEFEFVTTEDLEISARAIQPTGLRLLAHAEDPQTIEKASQVWTGENGKSYNDYLLSRPEKAEEIAVETLVRISKKYDIPVHVVHVASAKAVDIIRAAKKEGVNISAETCAHYLNFSSEMIPKDATQYKCAPPIRNANIRDALWNALDEGVLDFITTDHSPSLSSLKGVDPSSDIFGRFDKAWGGIASIQLLLSVVWTEADKRGFSLERVSKWLSQSPAAWNGLSKKGKIEVGYDADIIIFDAEKEFTIEASQLFHRHKITPYDQKKCKGKIIHTFVNGNLAYDVNDLEKPKTPFGKLI